MWHNEPPTKAGYYYLLQEGGIERICKLNDYGVFSIDGTLLGYKEDLIELGFKFGSKVPSQDKYNELFDFWLISKIDENTQKHTVSWESLSESNKEFNNGKTT